jgi:hypothetical protein
VSCVSTIVSIIVALFFLNGLAVRASDAPKLGGAILFADAHSKARFEAYRAFLEKDPVKFASELATVERLERSDVQYVVSVVARFDGRIEGELSTDGERVLVSVSDLGGPHAEVASLNSRFAHELEHARQFDAGELGLARDATTGRWASQYSSYDLGDEVEAWEAQLDASTVGDFWMRRDGMWIPTLLRLFANSKSDERRAQVLAQHGYSGVNPVFGSNVCFGATSGYTVGQLVRPDPSRGINMFGRVYAVQPNVTAATAHTPREGGL